MRNKPLRTPSAPPTHPDRAPDLDRPPPQGVSRPPPTPPVPNPGPHPRVRRAYLGRSCSASRGASSAQASGFLPGPRPSGPAARTVRGAQPAQGLQGGGAAARHPGRSSEAKGGKREKKGEKVCHRLEGGGKCKTRQEMRLKKCKRLEKR